MGRSDGIEGSPKARSAFGEYAWQGWNVVHYNGSVGYAAEAYIEN